MGLDAAEARVFLLPVGDSDHGRRPETGEEPWPAPPPEQLGPGEPAALKLDDAHRPIARPRRAVVGPSPPLPRPAPAGVGLKLDDTDHPIAGDGSAPTTPSHLKIMSSWGMNLTQQCPGAGAACAINVGSFPVGCGDEWTPSLFRSRGLPGFVSAPVELCGHYNGPWPCNDEAKCNPDITGRPWPLNASEGKQCKPASGKPGAPGYEPGSTCHGCMCTGWEERLEVAYKGMRPFFDNGTYLGVFLGGKYDLSGVIQTSN